MNKAVFPGSFDPITRGHEALIHKALPLFDEIVLAIGNNSQKNYLYTIEQRTNHLKCLFGDEKKISVQYYSGLTVNFCKEVNANYIIRGLRNTGDFEFEKGIAQMNKAMSGIETVFFFTDPELSAISSTILRDIIKNGGQVSNFIPKGLQL